MSTIKEALHNTIAGLDDEEARQVLEFAEHLRKKAATSPTMKRLADDPAFEAPSDETGPFRVVQPVQGKGIPASELLVEDRR